jgi:hypothetical protein
VFVALVYAVRLSTELLLVLGVAAGAGRLGSGWSGTALAIVAAGAAVAIWGSWIAPRARRRLPDPARALTELALFAWACAGFVIAGWMPLAIGMAVIAPIAALAIRWVGEPLPFPDRVHESNRDTPTR